MESVMDVVRKNGKKPVVKKVVKKAQVKAPVSNEAIAKKAYELYEKRGGQNGSPEKDWLEAKKILEAGE